MTNAFTAKPRVGWVKELARNDKNRRQVQSAAQRPTKAQLTAFHNNFRHDKAKISKSV